MGEEILPHERVIALWVVPRDANVFVLESCVLVTEFRVWEKIRDRVIMHTILKVTTFSKETSPALYFSTRILYRLSGEEPVGRPSTKGCAGVGAKCLMRSVM